MYSWSMRIIQVIDCTTVKYKWEENEKKIVQVNIYDQGIQITQWGTRPSATTKAGSVVSRLVKLDFECLDPLKQVMVERKREK